MVTPDVRISQLPNQIPPQSAPVLMDGGNGSQVFETNWWLFLYNIANQVLTLAGGSVNLPDSVSIAILDSEIFDTDALQSSRQVTNLALMAPDIDAGPTLRDFSSLMALASDGLLPDVSPRAQPAAAVTVGASPFTFTASFDGTLAVSGGTVSAISLTRQGVTVPMGVVAGPIPVSRLDQVQITYTVLPTANFLPS